MIRLDRNKHIGGRLVEPDQQWRDTAAAKTMQAEQDGPSHVVDDNFYGADTARAALEELTNLKCAYCETSIVGFAWDVEHYRPKGRVKERPNDHPGYYWLAYTWTNLLASCTFCNQRRKERPVFDGTPTAGSGGKLDQFPIANEPQRAMAPGQDLDAEGPLLLDPCIDDPAEHLGYLPNGTMFALNRSPRGQACIDVFRLNLVRSRRRRFLKVEEIRELLSMRKRLEVASLTQAVAEIDALIDLIASDAREYAGVARYFRRNPSALGIMA